MCVEHSAVGAEATVSVSDFLGRKAVKKVRSPKTYRHGELDRRLRTSRTKNEVRVMRSARSRTVRTPVVYDIDMESCTITMEYIEGRRVKEVLDAEDCDPLPVLRKIGETLADMHNRGISHGDFTTSNMILAEDGKLCVIDFSLGTVKAGPEEMGVDIRLLQRAFSSAHSAIEGGFGKIMEAYAEKKTDAEKVLAKAEEIKNRARYT